AHFRDQRAESLVHVTNLVELVVLPLPVEAQDRNTEAVNDIWIDLAIRVVVRDHLATAGEPDRRAVVTAAVVLQFLAVAAAGRIALYSAHETRTRLVDTAPHLDVVPAREIQLLVVEPP